MPNARLNDRRRHANNGSRLKAIRFRQNFAISRPDNGDEPQSDTAAA